MQFPGKSEKGLQNEVYCFSGAQQMDCYWALEDNGPRSRLEEKTASVRQVGIRIMMLESTLEPVQKRWRKEMSVSENTRDFLQDISQMSELLAAINYCWPQSGNYWRSGLRLPVGA